MSDSAIVEPLNDNGIIPCREAVLILKVNLHRYFVRKSEVVQGWPLFLAILCVVVVLISDSEKVQDYVVV